MKINKRLISANIGHFILMFIISYLIEKESPKPILKLIAVSLIVGLLTSTSIYYIQKWEEKKKAKNKDI